MDGDNDFFPPELVNKGRLENSVRAITDCWRYILPKAPGMMHGVSNEKWKLLYLMKLHVLIDSLLFITSVLPRAA
jgi:hypothetical protein